MSRQIGHRPLELLAEEWSVPVLRALIGGPRRPSELERQVDGAPHSVLMRRLGELESRGILAHRRHRGLPPQAIYELTDIGRRLMDVVIAATRWEREWATTPGHGSEALRLIGDELTRNMIIALTGGPSTASELHSALPLRVARSTLRQRLADLAATEVIRRSDTERVPSYDLGPSARSLALVEVAAARWEWECATSAPHVAARDIAGVLRLFAPDVRLPAELGGVCELRVDEGSDGPAVYLAANGHRLADLTLAPPSHPEAACKATTHGWCEALLAHRWSGVTFSGNRELMTVILLSVTAAIAT